MQKINTEVLNSTEAGPTWHVVIPPDQLWLMVGRDNGHGTFKFNL